jgi:hypothetical protein
MQPFDITFEELAEVFTGNILETSRALTHKAVDILEPSASTEPAPFSPQPDTNRALPTGEMVVASNEFVSQTAAETEAAVLAALRTQRGARAHYLGETVGALVGRILGALRIRAWSNHHALEGMPFQIRTINGQQNTFTVNRDTEPEKILVAVKKRDKNLLGSSRYILYGVLREDAFAIAKKSLSRGHVKSGHHQVSLTQVAKVELGSITIPDDLVMADTSDQRNRLLDRINLLEPDLDDPTVQAARAFLASAPVPTDAVIESAPDAPMAEPMDLNTLEASL